MARLKSRHAAKKPVKDEIDISALNDNDGPMEGPEPPPRIDRRHIPRTTYQITAWLSPADDTGAIRRPIIRTRDLSIRALGFRARQDVSAMRDAILRLPAATGRCIAVECRVRRSRETADGWFDCLIEFLQPQPDLALRHAQLCLKSDKKKSDNHRDNQRRRK